jgi:hypothetical protein
MTTSSEHEPAPSSEDAIKEWREWFAVARDVRQQSNEPAVVICASGWPTGGRCL